VAAPSLAEKVLLLEESLARHGIPHAFGGAIALAYYATPRATVDIDLNVFTPVDRAEATLAVLHTLGAEPLTSEERTRLARDGQARARWEGTPVGLFFSYDPFHESCLARRREVPFGEGDVIHVLSAEDLVVFKALFDRDKDWRDIDELLFAAGDAFEADYARDWLGRIVGEGDPRHRRLAEALARGA
jgi:Nucleotidyl transferase AbiEii toxin, Type IV TA system